MDVQNERRELWSDLNSMKDRRVPVYVLDMVNVCHEVAPDSELKCEDPLLRDMERRLRLWLYRSELGDDCIVEPWISVDPDYTGGGANWQNWGFEIQLERISETLAYHLPEPPVKTKADLVKVVTGTGVIDEAKTREKVDRLTEAAGGALEFFPCRYPPKACGLSYSLALLLGPERMMYQFYDDPDMVRELCKTISDASLAICDAAEAAGNFTNRDSSSADFPYIQAMPYSRELPNPGETRKVGMKEHWIFDAAQEFEGAGPDIFEEFLLAYQRPIYEKFGLTAYGCCENLTKKIVHLKKIKNLRRVAVTPWANIEDCARQLGDKYVISWRPNPSLMVSKGFDPDRVTRIVKNAKEIFDRYGCFWEVNLKDFITVERDRNRLANWVKAVRAALGQ